MSGFRNIPIAFPYTLILPSLLSIHQNIFIDIRYSCVVNPAPEVLAKSESDFKVTLFDDSS